MTRVNFTHHAFARAKERSVSHTLIKETVKTPSIISRSRNGTFRFIKLNCCVIVAPERDNAYTVITCYKLKQRGTTKGFQVLTSSRRPRIVNRHRVFIKMMNRKIHISHNIIHNTIHNTIHYTIFDCLSSNHF